MRLLVVDCGMGNIGSVRRSLEECGAEVIVSKKSEDIIKVKKIVLPGVGAFPDGMSALHEGGWAEAIKQAVLVDNKAVLGICLGMQLLATKSYEGGETTGLGLIPGEVMKFNSCSEEVRIPHVGWNEVYSETNTRLMSDIRKGEDFYFVHSYHFIPKNNSSIIAKTPYCGEFVSVISSGSVHGVQFHPEKSSKAGFQLLKNFINL